MVKFIIGFIVICFFTVCGKHSVNNIPDVDSGSSTFKNPLLPSGPDPWVAQKDGFYYYTNTLDNRIALWKTKAMSQLKDASITTVWSPPPGTPYSRNIWAPEIHFLQNKWYIYFAADSAGVDSTHRLYVLENANADPTTGSWTFKGKVSDPDNHWALDPSEFEYNNASYLIWSGWMNRTGGQQNIYIAKLSNPWTIEGNRVLISSPANSWERNGFPVNEGPEALVNKNGNVFLVYSASFCGTDNYCLGMLTLKPGSDPMNAANWTKSPQPVFATDAADSAYGPGHNGFFLSPDKQENWIVYHANNRAGQGCGNTRNPRIQKFTWNADGSPNFGTPVAVHTPLAKPSGE